MSYKYDASVRYGKTHEWARREGDLIVVGISDYAQDLLSDVVFVEMPEIGRMLTAGTPVAVVESVKAAEDVYAPVSGEVVAVNDALGDTPETVNTDPYGSWFFKVRASDASEFDRLMDVAAYETYLTTLEEH